MRSKAGISCFTGSVTRYEMAAAKHEKAKTLTRLIHGKKRGPTCDLTMRNLYHSVVKKLHAGATMAPYIPYVGIKPISQTIVIRADTI
jgi:hypothetical protein